MRRWSLRFKRSWIFWALIPLFVLFFSLVFRTHAFSNESILINGAGASFPYPLYSKWFKIYKKHHPDIKINYQSIGSGGGVRQVLKGIVDFGASDTPMKDLELEKSTGFILHFPTILGAVAMTYNLPKLKSPLRLNSKLIVGIFSGRIRKWNHPHLVKFNPELKKILHHITPIRRADGSGTTAVFTDYLSKVSPYWKKEYGQGKAIKWPTGLGGKGNEGVTGLVKQNIGSIGYVELTYAQTGNLKVASVQNSAGKYVTPHLEAISLAAQGVQIPDDMRVSITNSTHPQSYPISSFTYLLIPEAMPRKKGLAFKEFLRWSLSEGQRMAPTLHYAPLPESLIGKLKIKIEQLNFNINN